MISSLYLSEIIDSYPLYVENSLPFNYIYYYIFLVFIFWVIKLALNNAKERSPKRGAYKVKGYT